jgi:putative ABC transport system substrate-binding protein
MRLIALAAALAFCFAPVPFAAEVEAAAKVYRIGIVINAGPAPGAAGAEPIEAVAAGLLRGLRDLGYAYGRDFVTEARSAEGKPDRIPAIAADLATLKVDVIVAGGPALEGLKRAGVTIPVVMAGAGADPVQAGLVASLRRPGGNFTGFSLQHGELDRKRLELITDIVPTATRVGVLRHSGEKRGWNDSLTAARLLKRDLVSLEVRSANEIEGAFRTAKEAQVGALVVIAGALLDREAQQIVEQAAKHRLPAMYAFRTIYMSAGGLVSYGVDLVDIWRRAAVFVDKILKGAKPSDLPVEQPTKFELVVNLRTAKALGLTIPQTVLLRADHIIE